MKKLTKIIIIKIAKTGLLINITLVLYILDRVYNVFPFTIPDGFYMLIISTLFKDNQVIIKIAKYILSLPKRKKNV